MSRSVLPRVAWVGLVSLALLGREALARSDAGVASADVRTSHDPEVPPSRWDDPQALPPSDDSAVHDAERGVTLQRLQYDKFRYQHAEAQFEAQGRESTVVFFVANALVFIGVYFAWVQFKRDGRRQETVAMRASTGANQVEEKPEAGAANDPAAAGTNPPKPASQSKQPDRVKEEPDGGESSRAANAPAAKGNAPPKPTSAGESLSQSTSPTVSQLELGLSGVKVSSPVLGVVILTLSLGFYYLYLRYVYPVNNVHQLVPALSEPKEPKGQQ